MIVRDFSSFHLRTPSRAFHRESAHRLYRATAGLSACQTGARRFMLCQTAPAQERLTGQIADFLFEQPSPIVAVVIGRNTCA